jgi:hypothetical protein
MAHKFPVGQAVEYKPKQGSVNLYTVVKLLPQEDGQFDFKYRIKNEHESFERNVCEYDLTIPDRPPNLYSFIKKIRHSGHH